VNSRQLDGVVDVRDESDRDGMRVVVEIRRSGDPNFVREQLYTRTRLQVRVSVNLVGLIGREPKVLTLMDIMREFLEFRCESIERRARHELSKASSRLHVVEGYLAVQAAPDAVVAAIRAAKDGPEAQKTLQEAPFSLSKEQSEAVLAMPLRRLTGLEHDKLRAEEADLTAKVEQLNALLSDRALVIAAVASEAKELRDKYGVERKTLIDHSAAKLAAEVAEARRRSPPSGDGGEDVGNVAEREMAAAALYAKRMNIPLDSLDADNLIVMTGKGYIKRIDPKIFSRQNKGTIGKKGGRMRGGDQVTKVTHCNGLDTVLFFTDRGRVYAVRAYDIPQSSTTALGTPFTRVLKLAEGETITAMLPVDTASRRGSNVGEHLVMLTARGVVKKTPISEFANINRAGKRALGLQKGDRLKHVDLVRDGDGIMVAGVDGMVLHFSMDSIRAQSRIGSGVKAMKFREASAGATEKKPKKPPAAHMLFAADARANAPEGTSYNMAEVSKMWRELSDEEKAPYEVKAADLKEKARRENDAEKKSAPAADGAADDGAADDDDDGDALPVLVAGMSIVPSDVVAAFELATESDEAGDDDDAAAGDEKPADECGAMVLLVTSEGQGKRISVGQFRQKGRGGLGNKAIGLEKGSRLAAMCITGVDPALREAGDAECVAEEVIIGSTAGVLNRYDVTELRPQLGRNAKGVKLMKLNDGDTVRDITLLPVDAVEL